MGIPRLPNDGEDKDVYLLPSNEASSARAGLHLIDLLAIWAP